MLVSQSGEVQCLKLTHILQVGKRLCTGVIPKYPPTITHLFMEKDTTDCKNFTPVLPHLKEP